MFIMLGIFQVLLSSCSSTPVKSIEKLDLNRFMGNWYVIAGRFTPFETEVHNGIETYRLKNNKIDIEFNYHQGRFDGPKKTIRQRGTVIDKVNNSHWKVSPFWPLQFDFIVVAVASDYSWTAVGVPNQKYLWIMARDYKNADTVIREAVSKLQEVSYRSDELTLVPHKY